MNKKEMYSIIEVFNKEYGEAKCSLNFSNEIELLVATQLSAQCTDERVNIVTEKLFKKYKTLDDFANADLIEFQQDIKQTGFYRNKSKNIINCCKILRDKYDGKIPRSLEEVILLPGVGRKTGNLVLGDIYNIPGLVIDTHAKRLAKRIGFTNNDEPFKVEKDMMKILPKKYWNKFCHQLVWHGRKVCKARKPKCNICLIKNMCNYGKNIE